MCQNNCVTWLLNYSHSHLSYFSIMYDTSCFIILQVPWWDFNNEDLYIKYGIQNLLKQTKSACDASDINNNNLIEV